MGRYLKLKGRVKRPSGFVFALSLIVLFLVVIHPRKIVGQVISIQSRGTTCSTALPDGRSLVTGGATQAVPLASAKLFELRGRLTQVAPMHNSRKNHTCIAMQDRTVLVTGGEKSKDGVISDAEIYHPDTNTWTDTLPLLRARRGASAVLLKNGKALIVGGEADGRVIDTLEFYDPTTGRFEQAPGALSAARTRYALAVLDDGRVLIAGGIEAGRAIDFIDIYDPELGVRFSGRMLTARANFTATTLANGKVLLAGGTDGKHELASAEIYDPATGDVTVAAPMASPRQNHIAVRSRSSDVVLIGGGTADGREVSSAEIFVPERGAFELAQQAGEEQENGPTITIGSLNADATIRSTKTYRLPKPAPVVAPEIPASNP
jgi:hypothetical protein